MVTRRTGFSYSDVEPMSNEPAGTTTSSVQSGQSRNIVSGLGAGASGVGRQRGRGGGRGRRGRRGRCRPGRWSRRWGRSGRRYRARRRAETEFLDQRRSHPRHLLVVGCTRYADARAVEYLLGGEIGDPQLLDQFADEQAVCTGAVVDHLARRSRVHRERAIERIECGKPRRRRSKPALERISSGSIENDDLYLCPFLCISASNVSTLMPSRRTSASVQTCALTGMR